MQPKHQSKQQHVPVLEPFEVQDASICSVGDFAMKVGAVGVVSHSDFVDVPKLRYLPKI